MNSISIQLYIFLLRFVTDCTTKNIKYYRKQIKINKKSKKKLPWVNYYASKN